MALIKFYYFLFGLIAIVGGAMGYARAQSKASLIAGAISGALLILAGLLMPSLVGSILALVVSVLLLAYFARSYVAKRKPMPAIPMIAFSAIGLVLSVIAISMLHGS
jgi:uncharacterized membrane protein (UPF0136 family)